MTEHFRPNVGAVLKRDSGLILMARRIGYKDGWQLPQGGVDSGESLTEALWRELGEELGLDAPSESCELLARAPEGRYRFPPAHRRKRGYYVGQRQTLFLLRYNGSDEDFQLDAHHKPEFDAVQWVTPERALDLIWPVKRPILKAALDTWGELVGAP